MNTRHLSLFATAAELGSITETAKHTMISQPAVSMQLKRLEEEMDVVLFTVQGRGIVLTDAGKSFLEYCKKILTAEEQLFRAMDEYKKGHKGHIVVGASSAICTYVMPPLLPSFYEKHPDIRLDIAIFDENEIEKLVKEGRIDLGIMFSSSILDHIAYRVTPFAGDSWMIIESNQTVHSTRYYIDKNLYFAFQNHYPQLIQVESTEMVKQLVLSGAGRGIVLQSSILHEIALSAIKHFPVPDQEDVFISIITRPAERLAKSVWFLIKHLSSPLT